MRAANLVAHAGIITAALFLALVYAAVMNFSGYDPSTNYLSDLGAHGASSLFFNAGIIASGIVAAFFGFWAFRNIFSRKKGRLGMLGCVAIAISGISMIGIGLYPSQSLMHDNFTVLFFGAIFVAMPLIAAEFRSKSFSPVTAAPLLVMLAFFATRTPLMEHVSVGAVMLWCIAANIVFVRKYELEISRVRDGFFDALEAR